VADTDPHGVGARRPANVCQGCIYFFVTYEPRFPYGCRVMGFKSRRYPFVDVLEATGKECQTRELRVKR
jgi:hypothetical protein